MATPRAQALLASDQTSPKETSAIKMHAASAFALSDAFVSMLSRVAQSSSRRFAASVSLVEALAHSLGSIASTRGFCGLKQAISSVWGQPPRRCEKAGEAAGFEF